MEKNLVINNNRRQLFDDIQKNMAYVLFAGVILVVLQGFFALTLLGKVTNTTYNNSHFMYYTQFYLKFCAMLLTAVLVTYYVFRIIRVIDNRDGLAVSRFFKNNAILLPLLFMLVWAFIATMKSPDVEKSLYGSGYINEGFFTVLQYSVVFLSAYAVRNELKFSKIAVAWTFVGLASLISFIMIGIMILEYPIYTAYRAGVFNNSNHYGYFLAMSTTATFALLVYSKKMWQTMLLSVLLILNLFNLFYCNALGANLAYIGGVVFIICSGLLSRKINIKNLIIAVLVSGMAILVFEASGLTIMWKSYEKLFSDLGLIANEVSGVGEEGSANGAGSGRMRLWKGTIAVIKQVPWFGKGLDLYYKNNIYDPTLDVPHNEYLAIASNMGIPGLVFYLITIIWWFAIAVKQRKTLGIGDLVTMSAAFAYLISAFTGNSFTYTYPYFLIFWAMSMQSPKSDKKYEKWQKLNEGLTENSSSPKNATKTIDVWCIK